MSDPNPNPNPPPAPPAPSAKTVKVRILVDCTDGERAFACNTVAELDEKTAKSFVKSGYADSDPAAVQAALEQAPPAEQ